MRTFFEEWSGFFDSGDFAGVDRKRLEEGGAPMVRHLQVPNSSSVPLDDFYSIGFTHHREILSGTKDVEARLYYIHRCAEQHWSVESLKSALRSNEFSHRGSLPNNFAQTISESKRAFRAISAFKDEYLLDFLNVEELGVRDEQDVDERVLEQGVVHAIKNFILAFGRGFAFVGNQFHLEAFGEHQYVDLLFFNRDLNCLVAVELKREPFKTAYLGQLSGYLSVLDGFERRPHENPSIGLILCKDMNRSFVDYVVRDYGKPLGVATYRTSKEMPNELLRALPPIDELKALLNEGERTV